jgi:dipeptidyl-peptidase-3
VAGFYANMSNYHSFGGSKFVPELSPEKFRGIILSNPLHTSGSEQGQMYREFVDRLYPLIDREIFSLEKPFTSLGLPEEGGVTAYFSPSMTSGDLTLIRDFLSEIKLSPLNTRAFKNAEDNSFTVTVGSIEAKKQVHTFRDKQITVEFGEFAPYLEEVNYYLSKALQYVANDN